MSEPTIIEISDPLETPETVEVLIGLTGPAGGGTVYSVNGQSGPAVSLDAEGIGAIPSNSILSGGTY
jgi:hypothetical protein